MAAGTVFYIFSAAVSKITTASFAQIIKRTITEKAIKINVILYRVAREILTLMIAEKPEAIIHDYTCDPFVIS